MKLSVFYQKSLHMLSIMSLICLNNPLKAMDELDNENTSMPVKFAAIGDYGTESEGSIQVAALVKSKKPNFIITLGDNNYPSGEAETIDKNIGAFI